MRRMGQYVRRHFVAFVALIVALGGTSYAATNLPARSVGTVQLRPGAVTDAKVAVHSLTSRVFAHRGSRYVVHAMPIPSAAGGAETGGLARCQHGERLVSGGYDVADPQDTVTENAPIPKGDGDTPRGWEVRVANPFPEGATVYAVCTRSN